MLYYSAGWQVIEERESGVVQAQQVWSPVYVDAMILRDRNANGISGDGPGGSGLEQRHYVAHDANFNVTALIDGSTGAVAERYYYQAYGRPVVLDANFAPRATGQSQFAWRYLHQGGRFDWAAGNYHFRNRDLSPTLGRWLNLDPIEFEGSKWNLYEYVEGRPLLFSDPSGLLEVLPNTPIPGTPFPSPYSPFPGGPTPGTPFPGGSFPAGPNPPTPKVGNPHVVIIGACTYVFNYLGQNCVKPALEKVFCDLLDPGHPPVQPPPPKCKPCNSAVGTPGWLSTHLTGEPHYNKKLPPLGAVPTPHMHFAKVNQTPYPDCVCHWNKQNDVIPGSNNSGMPDANQPVTGGGPG